MSVITKIPLDYSELSKMINTINSEYPEAKTDLQKAVLISEYFNVDCSEIDIIAYNEIYERAFDEDFELESRKQEYGYIY